MQEEAARRPGKEPIREEPVPSAVEIVQGAASGIVPIKVDAKLELPVYNGEVDGE